MIVGRTWWTAPLVTVALVGYLPSAVTSRPPSHRILIPLDWPVAVEQPMQVDVVDSGGARGLRIPPGAGRGWAGEAGGTAVYRFHIPQEARYTPWAYYLWQGPCSNAVFAGFDEADPFILGNDPVYTYWHWVRGPDVKLSRGTHKLTLSNHSDHIALSRLMLLSDPADRPDGSASAVYDLFYDGFDGCDGGNITVWRLDTSGWALAEPLGEDRYEARVLHGRGGVAGPDSNRGAYAVIGDASWRNIALTISAHVHRPGSFALCFDFNGPQDHLALRWRPAATGAPTNAVEAWRVAAGVAQLLGACEVPAVSERWREITIQVENERLVLYMDGREAGRIDGPAQLNGPVALYVGPGADVWFDDVHVRSRVAADLTWSSGSLER